MSRLVFLLEEYSMKVLLEGLLPRLFPDLEFQCIPHEGKNDLEASIPRKLRAWREPNIRFVVVRDNDGGDCRALKASLRQLCESNHRSDTLVRIPCQEMEAWYFGDPDALSVAYADESLRTIARRARFRDPDAIVRPSDALSGLVPGFQKVSGARRIAPHMSRERNRSRSFQVMMDGLDRFMRQESFREAA